jgi:isopentenyl diphosphate isomerase/L-lactate dehydrogenase-like FMN-dependent dehydrogenase
MASSPGPGPQRQSEIFAAGIEGRKPSLPIPFEELEQRAREVLPPEAFGYVSAWAGSGRTHRANLDAFERWRLIPRFLRDVAQRDLTVKVLGKMFPAPFFVGPVGVQGLLHPDGDLATARAARGLGLPMVLSTVSSYPMEKIAETLGDTPHWFQVYWPADPELAGSFVQRAERCGCTAIVVTLDCACIGWREVDLQQGFNPFVRGQGLANYFSDPVFRGRLPSPPEADPAGAVRHWVKVAGSPIFTWADLATLQTLTKLPIILKGVLHPDDARQAVDRGVAGIVVSNHGGRQLDGAVAALDKLPEIVSAVGGRTEILFDSGIRRGADVVKAIALGAQATLVARPWCYGLGLAGEAGVTEVLRNLLAEVDVTFALAGITSVKELSRENLSS